MIHTPVALRDMVGHRSTFKPESKLRPYIHCLPSVKQRLTHDVCSKEHVFELFAHVHMHTNGTGTAASSDDIAIKALSVYIVSRMVHRTWD